MAMTAPARLRGRPLPGAHRFARDPSKALRTSYETECPPPVCPPSIFRRTQSMRSQRRSRRGTSSLRVPAFRAMPPPAREFFFGKGRCASCHFAQGEGAAIGPDLSDIASSLTVDEIRDALLTPDERIAPGYGVVSVRRGDGRTLRGFARNRSSFDIAVQDLTGAIHTLSLDDVASITDEKTSHMAAVKATDAELRDVIAFLSRMTGVRPALSYRRVHSTGIDFGRILNPRGDEWATFNGNVSGNRYSPLTAINKSNVSKLGVEVDVHHSAVDAVPSGHSVLSREHAVLRTGDGPDRCGRHDVRDGTEPGVRARSAHGPSDLALLAPAHRRIWFPMRHSGRTAASRFSATTCSW